MVGQTILEVTNWRLARQQGWQFNDASSPGFSGRISFQNDRLLIVNDSGEDSSFAEIFNPTDLSYHGRFAVEVRMRFIRIGLDDNGTGAFSFMTLEVEAQSHLNAGFTLQFVGDRYKVDAQYKIYRTDDQWHVRHFEVMPDREMITMSRDGQYVCAHRIRSSKGAGIRFRVYGRKSTPTEVEIDYFKVYPSQAVWSPVAPQVKRPQEALLPGEWPMFRRDVRNSGYSPLKGNLTHPAIRWKYPLGGYTGSEYIADINDDGQDEVVLAYPGRLVTYRLDGSILWSLPWVNTSVVGKFDLDSDGREELLVIAGSPRAIHVVDGRTGQVLYRCTYDPKYGVSAVRVAKLDPNRKGLQVVAWTRHELGYCVSFEEGVENGKVSFTYNWVKTNFVPEVVLADMDNDDLLEIVVATYDNFFVFDGQTGQLKMKVDVPTGRNYGLLTVRDIDQDGFPDIVMLANQLREHLAVVQNERGKSLRLLWDKFYEQNYPIDQKELRVLEESVNDFDGDGKTEILYGLYDETADSTWRTIVVDAWTGEMKYELKNRYPVAVAEFFSGQPKSVLLSVPRGRRELNVRELELYTFKGSRPTFLAKLPKGEILVNNSFRDFSLDSWSMSQTPTTIQHAASFENGVFQIRFDSQNRPIAVEFLQGQMGNRLIPIWSCQLPAGELPVGRVLGVRDVGEWESPCVLFAGQDMRLYVIDRKGGIVGRFDAGGYVGHPIVADLSGSYPLRVLVSDAFDTLRCLKPKDGNKPPSVEWIERIVGTTVPWEVEQGSGLPVVADLDLDGRKEIIVGKKANRLSVLNGDGTEKESYKLAARPTFWSYGNFSGDSTLDIFVSYNLGTVACESVVLKGNGDPKPLWKMGVGNQVPAVFDANGDGIDDVILRDLYEHRSLDGRNGRDLFPITQWAGYHVPVVVSDSAQKANDKDTTFIVWTGGNYSLVVERLDGQQLWWRPFMAQRRPGGVADVDGDGRVEIGSVTVGQLYNWPEFYPVDGPNKQFVCYDALTGEVKWMYDLQSSASGIITADVDGDGRPEFIFGTDDGRLMALNGDIASKNRVAFEIKFPASLGTPIVVDLFGNGKMQILVGCADGYLYCIE